MVVEGLDPVIISKFTSQQVEQVTCPECCKYFISPETASCGHTLCHSCWKGRRTCHACAAPILKKALKINIPLQSLTEHVHSLADAFEKLFNLKLEEFTLEILDDLQSEDPTKNVKEWLASSQNHFSAPAISSQNSEQETIKPMELSKSSFQVHIHKKKSESPNKVVHQLQSQDDWDKIEVLPDTEEDIREQPRDHGIGPMDFEPFFLDDYEYTSDNPRRSSRKRDGNADPDPPTRDVSVDKISGKNSSDAKSHKTKQIWGNVKKMKKEFGKLNKKNKSKLNVSIEMAKKAAASKQKTATPPQGDSERKLLNIDDNTPVADDLSKEKELTPEKDLINNKMSLSCKSRNENYEEIIEICTSNKNNSVSRNGVNDLNCEDQSSCQQKQSQTKQNTDNIDEREMHSNETQSRNDNNVFPKSQNVKEAKVSCINTADKPVNMPFVKKSTLFKKTESTDQNDVQITQKEIQSNSITTNSDDIEISIRIGNTLTNIVIKNKRNDVQFKVNTDQSIQASLGPYGLIEKNDAGNSPIQELNVQNVEVNTEENNKVAVNKSFSTKKNTASADTATAQFEITDSMERELSDVMECLERKRKRTQNSQNIQQLPKVIKNVVAPLNKKASEISKKSGIQDPEVEKNELQVNNVHENMEDVDDVDIFNSGSMKDGNSNVKLLKDTRKAASEILIPTIESKKLQKTADKRYRDSNDDEQPNSKKTKIDLDRIEEDIPAGVSETQTKEMQGSENMNYDVIMSQVFANIDADIETSSKNKNIDMATQVLKQKSNETVLDKPTQSHPSQIIYTPHVPSRKCNSDIEMHIDSKDAMNQKDSENVFSMLDKDSEPVEKDVPEQNNEKVTTSTQQHIENLLTPGMCRDLVATRDSRTSSLMDKMEELILVEPGIGTPNIDNDDSDKSVVEETPQKSSFTRPEVNDILKTKSSSSSIQKQLAQKVISPAQNNIESKNSDSQIIKSIINISDTTMKDTTFIDVDKKKHTLETPLTINKFVNHIIYNSTPVARKSLNFETENIDDPEQTMCPTTTQEKEFLADAFKQTPTSPIKRPLTLKNIHSRQNRKYFVAGSCLTSTETKNLKMLCQERGWTYLDKYSQELTHLVVGVDEENKSQRSVKYMCALAASKWIVSYCWVEKCLQLKTVVDELPYEALDACGEPGPRRSRTAIKKIFEGMAFYCMPPFSVLDLDTLKQMLQAAGGRVVEDPQGVKITRQTSSQVLLLLAEPEHTQEDRFVYLAMEHSVVPVNYEWALNCLGTYTLGSVHDLLLCPTSLLPPATSNWPAVLLLHEDEDY